MPGSGKTFFLWDMAGTLFPEVWEKEKTGFASFDDYVASRYDLNTIDPADYEGCYEQAYKQEMFNVSLPEGFAEVLLWAKYNGVFTTGLHGTLLWRAEQLQRKYGIDVLQYLPEQFRFSTFDFAHTNVKNPEMLIDILRKKRSENYNAVVYTDDKGANCKFFLESFGRAKNELTPMAARAYQITHAKQDTVQLAENYWQIGNLFQLQNNEQQLNS